MCKLSATEKPKAEDSSAASALIGATGRPGEMRAGELESEDSAPIIQPTQASFTSFAGKGEISGNLTQSDAQNLAQAMNFGALPITLAACAICQRHVSLSHAAVAAPVAPISANNRSPTAMEIAYFSFFRP